MLKGVVLSVGASALFGGMYYFSTLLEPLTGEQIFGWRLLLTLPFLTGLLYASGDTAKLRALFGRLRRQPSLLLALITSSALVGVQLWLFMWAPLHGRGLQVSLGYFLLPLVMVLAGRWVYRDKLSRWQWLAAGCATAGVANELLRIGGLSWETLLVALGYPAYFMLRRHLGTDHLGGLWLDMLIQLPVALLLIGAAPFAPFVSHPALWGLVPLLGVISATALACYIFASRLISFSLFGLLSYVEPVLLVLVSLLLGERIGANEWLTYLPIWTAVAVLVLEGALYLNSRRAALAAA
ncbi:EamA family transporter RarD [Crenobacter sp. SG2305]|uniref:EamA family transporter RarD n=1 Tax=Crenobacter oryzisoli TaxID=3056844 RepID=UPI0025AA6B61|nr:EamA family transporter RarD [Crenobacter sp. SG2305]MDN0082868.1 EamA family transporter RarD [Crenobacter sp. SG2305]